MRVLTDTASGLAWWLPMPCLGCIEQICEIVFPSLKLLCDPLASSCYRCGSQESNLDSVFVCLRALSLARRPFISEMRLHHRPIGYQFRRHSDPLASPACFRLLPAPFHPSDQETKCDAEYEVPVYPVRQPQFLIRTGSRGNFWLIRHTIST